MYPTIPECKSFIERMSFLHGGISKKRIKTAMMALNSLENGGLMNLYKVIVTTFVIRIYIHDWNEIIIRREKFIVASRLEDQAFTLDSALRWNMVRESIKALGTMIVYESL
jgi:hypothetical protein